MLSGEKLYFLARSRYEEAKILLDAHKPDGAVYLCGYAMELILKRKIVGILEWDGYPETQKEFEKFKSFKVHDLNVLLRLSGLEKKLQSDTATFARWQIIKVWNSEVRYREIGMVSEPEAQSIIDATRDTVNFVLASL